jgi:hypothetical protein
MSSQRGNTAKTHAKHHNIIAYDHNRGVKCSQGVRPAVFDVPAAPTRPQCRP